ncbi:MAG: hypothetical protein U1E57_04300 [Paenacidovorax caeni]
MAGLHVDAINDWEGVQPLINLLPTHKVLSLGVINGRTSGRPTHGGVD